METQNWFMKNISKITLVLAAVGAVSGVTALIVGITAAYKTSGLNYFLNPNHSVTWGDTKIWEFKNDGVHIDLYFGNVKENSYDIEWNGIYPEGYFNN